MTPEQFSRVRKLFDEAMDRPSGSRLEFLSEACADDSDVRHEVERLLDHEVSGELVNGVHRALASALETRDGMHDEDSDRDIVGRTLSHYRVLEELSRGGMGIVYKALDLKLNREVALKVLPPRLVSDPDRKRRFVREAQSAAALKHPNIAVVYEIDEVEGQTFIAMELIEGEMLSNVLKRGPLPVERAQKLALHVARGLAKAHDKGIVHRDVKPANIMVTDDGHAKIIDFGLAKLRFDEDTVLEETSPAEESPTLSRDTLPGTVMGTIGYMSPEQVRARDVDARSDIFSLGAVVYEMLSGHMAFGGETNLETLSAILHGRPPEIDGERGSAGALMRLVRRCLEKSAEDRFQTANELVAELERVEPSRIRAEKSVAILPFTNISPDPENEYFSDGMSEEIINALSKLGTLRVTARSSSFAFKGQLVDIADVGEKLNVDAVLEGSVRRAGDKLRITAQLINVADGYHLWSERYDRELGDVFAIQDEIATKIVEGLKVTLFEKQEQPLLRPGTRNLEAYQLYLQGRFFWNRRELHRALECFERAASVDPYYALAYAGVADANAVLGFGYGGDPRVVMRNAKRAAERALVLDGALAEAHYSLAYVSFVHDWDWSAAAREFQKAIELNPQYVAARYMYGWFLLLAEGRDDEAVEEARRAVSIDPLDGHATGMLCIILWAGGRAKEAIPLLEKAIAREPNYFMLHRCLGLAYVAESRLGEAVASLEHAATLSPTVLMELAWAHALAGENEAAEEILQELMERAREKYVSPCEMAFIQGALGRNDEAFALFERALRERDPIMVTARVWPRVYGGPLAADPRFESLLKRIGWK